MRTISSLRQYIPDTSQRPTNWPSTTKKRVDIAVLGRSASAAGWYGAIELKWPSNSIDIRKTRHRIVEDCIRVAFCKTYNLHANFLILGGTLPMVNSLFDRVHKQSEGSESQRNAFHNLFSRDLSNPKGNLGNSKLNQEFPDFGDRIPQTVFNGWSRRLATELVAKADAMVGNEILGQVYIWQCYK